MKHVIYCASIIIVAICAFILGQMQAKAKPKAKPTMIGLKTDGIIIDSVDRERSLECVLETIGLRENSEGIQ